jgi:hypothetical protein
MFATGNIIAKFDEVMRFSGAVLSHNEDPLLAIRSYGRSYKFFLKRSSDLSDHTVNTRLLSVHRK